jgi:hypothetical protein
MNVFGSLRRRLTYANVMSTVAVFLAIGGGAYAAVKLPRNSVGKSQIKNGAVTHRKLARRAVTGSNVAHNSLTGVQIKESTLGTVPNARHASTADTATNASHASSADAAQTLAAPEAFHGVGAAGQPGFQHSWTNHGFSADEPAGFYKDHEGIVHLQGQVVAGAPGTTIFQLPAGDRPDSGKLLRVPAAACDCLEPLTDPQGGTVVATVLNATVEIDGSGFGAGFDGSVILDSNSYLPLGQTLSLDGISFRAGS